VGVDVFTRRHDARAITFWQIAFSAALSLPLALFGETPRFNPTPSLAGAIALTALGGTAVAFAVQNAVQAKTTPARTAIIFTSEPVFAAATSYFVEGERLGAASLAGAALIVAGMLASEVPSFRGRAAPRAASG
jgi:drug/metabolite transporter (DMT)-like permease